MSNGAAKVAASASAFPVEPPCPSPYMRCRELSCYPPFQADQPVHSHETKEIANIKGSSSHKGRPSSDGAPVAFAKGLCEDLDDFRIWSFARGLLDRLDRFRAHAQFYGRWGTCLQLLQVVQQLRSILRRPFRAPFSHCLERRIPNHHHSPEGTVPPSKHPPLQLLQPQRRPRHEIIDHVLRPKRIVGTHREPQGHSHDQRPRSHTSPGVLRMTSCRASSRPARRPDQRRIVVQASTDAPVSAPDEMRRNPPDVCRRYRSMPASPVLSSTQAPS